MKKHLAWLLALTLCLGLLGGCGEKPEAEGGGTQDDAGALTPVVITEEVRGYHWAPAYLAETLGYPLFVKPVNGGSSYGISRVTAPEDLMPAVLTAFQHDDKVLLETAVDGVEVGCAIIGQNDDLTIGVVDEIEIPSGFFDFTEKYTQKNSAIHTPGRMTVEKAEEIQETARKLYRALDCAGFARVDMFLAKDGTVYFNEINTIPGFTSHSRYPTMMARAGIPFPELVARLIELGTARQ